jgi:uncharacterized membrane protein YqhA
MAAMEDQVQPVSPRQVRALRVFFGLRLVMLVGSVGAFLGSLLMFYQGFLYLGDALSTLARGEAGEDGVVQVTVPILEAVDSFLFGVVLVIFAYGIVVGFLVVLPEGVSQRLPVWMKIGGVGQLKQILAEVVVVVLIVIFARVVVESGGHFEWSMLVLPVAILLLAGAIWLLELGSEAGASHASEAQKPEQSP